MSCLQNVRSSKRPVAKKTPINILYLWLVEIRRYVAAMFAGKVMAAFYFLFLRFLVILYITKMASKKMTNTNTFCLISISNLKTGRFETRRFET